MRIFKLLNAIKIAFYKQNAIIDFKNVNLISFNDSALTIQTTHKERAHGRKQETGNRNEE
jgi:hypothetical protein